MEKMTERYTVPGLHARPPRVDVWLASVSAYTRSRIQSLMASGCVCCDGTPLTAASKRVVAGECYVIEPPPPEPVALQPQSMPLSILYEDDAVIVVDKPPGLVVHPAVGHPDGTLVNALLAHCPDVLSIGGEVRPGIVHRLDRDTSGVLVAAKTDGALAGLTAAFQSGHVHKTYATLVHGVPDPLEGRIENLIGRHPVHRQRMAVVARNGRPAITRYQVLEAWGLAAWLTVVIETGRTHQIRVHMKQMGCPVAGDATYGKAGLDAVLPVVPSRQMLHAWRLAFPHPVSGRECVFEAPLPADFLSVAEALRAAAMNR